METLQYDDNLLAMGKMAMGGGVEDMYIGDKVVDTIQEVFKDIGNSLMGDLSSEIALSENSDTEKSQTTKNFISNVHEIPEDQ